MADINEYKGYLPPEKRSNAEMTTRPSPRSPATCSRLWATKASCTRAAATDSRQDQGVEGTKEELIAYAKAALKDSGTVLSDEEISQVAGGRNGFVDGLNRYLGIDDEDVI